MSKIEKLVNAANKSDHWSNFCSFSKWEIKIGGPDPHMQLTNQMSLDDNSDWLEKAWKGLCYLGVYNVPTATVIWNEWPWEKIKKEKGSLFDWCKTNWKGISFRRERKCVRSPIKLGKFLDSAVSWLKNKEIEKQKNTGWMFDSSISPKERYDFGWVDIQKIYSMGRYVCIKYLEYCRRYLGVDSQPYDIRPKNGWSPREGLVLLWPNYAEELMGDDSKENLDRVNNCADRTKQTIKDNYGLDLDYYILQVLLCDYKQCYVGKRQFPGRSQDSEISYERKISPYWKRTIKEMYVARKKIFPKVGLGELNGWQSVRGELGDCLAIHGYMWSDFLYDYMKSKDRLDKPVRR